MSGTNVNMLDEEGEARVREAYGANYARLQHLKARYDPDNVFRSNQNIAPARSSSSPPRRL
jgi:FAD/FMN-containing dehydrogenase